MCEPGTIVSGVSVLGSALGMANSLASQKAQAEQVKKQEAQAFQNAKLAEENARKALVEGEKEKEKVRLEQKALQSKKAAEYGAANVDMGSGSPLSVLTDMAAQGEDSALDTGEKARQKAQNYQHQAQNYYQQTGASAKNPFAAANTVFSGLNSMTTTLGKNAASRRGPNYF